MVNSTVVEEKHECVGLARLQQGQHELDERVAVNRLCVEVVRLQASLG